MDVDKNFQDYMGARSVNDRYASFDYCYNYFQFFRETDSTGTLADPQNLQQSCLQIGFYLASWGMFRGFTFLLQKSLRFLTPLIHCIAQFETNMCNIDLDQYDDSLDRLMDCYLEVEGALRADRSASPTLVTKVMLGVFGSVPAFDDYFTRGTKLRWNGIASLKAVAQLYRDHRVAIDRHHLATVTIDFATGKETQRRYPRAKILDMVGFVEGDSLPKKKMRSLIGGTVSG